MVPTLVSAQPLDPKTGLRVTLRVGSAGEATALGFQGVPWEPAINRRPRIQQDLMSLDLDGSIKTATADVVIDLNRVTRLDAPDRLVWAGAPITIRGFTDGNESIEFEGRVSNAPFDLDTRKLTLNCETDKTRLDRNVLISSFTGGGGLAGEPAMRGREMPSGFGYCENIEWVLFDTVNNIGMLDGYGNLTNVVAAYEGLSSLGASVGDFPTYQALLNAILAKQIPPGRWGTCIAQGLVGLGAPAAGRISFVAQFAINRTGALMRYLVQYRAGVPVEQIDVASFDALDVAVNREIRAYITDQIKVDQMLEQLAQPVNANPIVTVRNLISITRPIASAAQLTLNRNPSSPPAVTDWRSAEPLVPTYRVAMRAARPSSVFEYSEVNYADTIVDRGLFKIDTVYRNGNIVWRPDGSSYLYINVSGEAGHVPPATNDAWWQQQTPPLKASGIINDIKYGTNQVVLSNFAQGLNGFRPGAGYDPAYYAVDGVGARVGNPAPLTRGINLLAAPGQPYFGRRNVAYGHWSSAEPLQPGTILDIFWTPGPWGGDSLASGQGYMLPVKQGDRVYGRVLAAAHRCYFHLFMLFFDANGNLTEAPGWFGGRDGGGQGGDPALFDELGGPYDVQNPGSAYAILLFRMLGKGGTDPYIFFTEPAMGQLSKNQMVLPIYTDGPPDPLADITALNQHDLAPLADIAVAADYQGNQTPGQFPFYRAGVRKLGATNVSPSTDFQLTVSGNVQATLDNAEGSATRGLITINLGSVGALSLLSTFRGVPITQRFNLSTVNGPAPVAGTGGGTTPPAGGGGGTPTPTPGTPSNTNTFTSPQKSTTYVLMASLSAVAIGSAGSARVVASLTFYAGGTYTQVGSANLQGRVTRSVNGGTETTIAEAAGNAAFRYREGTEYYEDAGSLDINQPDGGLPAGASVVYRIYGISDPVTKGVSRVQGSFSATPD